MKHQGLKYILATLDKAKVKGSTGSALLLGETARASLEHPKCHLEGLYHKVALKIYSGKCSLHSLLWAAKYNILDLLEGGRGRNGAPGNAREDPSVHSSSLSLAGVGRAGSSPHGRQHKRYHCVNPSPSNRQTAILFLIMSRQLHVEEVRKPAIFLSAILTCFPRLSLWVLQAWRALASCYCFGCSILL